MSHSSFFFNDPSTTEIYTLSLHDALPIFTKLRRGKLEMKRKYVLPGAAVAVATALSAPAFTAANDYAFRSEEHTSELQSRVDLVCRLLLEKKKKRKRTTLCITLHPCEAID